MCHAEQLDPRFRGDDDIGDGGLQRLLRALALLLLFLGNGWCAADPIATPDDAKLADHALDKIEQQLAQGTTDTAVTGGWLKELGKLKGRAGECVGATEGRLADIDRRIAALGEVKKGEPRDVGRARGTLDAERGKQEQLLSSCKLLALRSGDLAQQAGGLQQNLLTQELLARGPMLNVLLRDNLAQAPDWFTASGDFLGEHSGLARLGADDVPVLGVLLVAGLGGGLLLRRALRRHAERAPAPSGNGLYRKAAQVLSRYAVALLTSALIAVFFYTEGHAAQSHSLLGLAAEGLPCYILLLCLFRLLIACCPANSTRFALPDDIARALTRRLALLAFLLYAGFLLMALVTQAALPQPALLLLRAALIAMFALNLVWALWLLGHVPALARLRWPRRTVEVALLVIVTAEWVGYRNLALAGARGLFGTLLLLGLTLLAQRLLRELYDGLERGAHAWQLRLRVALGIQPGDPVPGLGWLRPLTTLAVWTAGALGLLWTWGLSDVGFRKLNDLLLAGFQVGSLHIVPARLVLALFALAVLLGLSGWIKGRLGRNWLQRTPMERSAREALVTVSGYTGVAVAVLVALGIAGVEFANLAIVAGALSVGIGFGLQNIINNFVSGLILLFERPIRTGDWIVVGSTEGHVKRISIRHTQIATFDGADVIVPNSDLISGQVTNWTLTDTRGRIRIPVRVAYYGNEAEKVRDLLLEQANAHPLVLKTAGSEPKVMFESFGDGLLQFELRCYIANINQCAQVQSDLNFALDAALRAADIDVPAKAPLPSR